MTTSGISTLWETMEWPDSAAVLDDGVRLAGDGGEQRAFFLRSGPWIIAHQPRPGAASHIANLVLGKW